jgi:ornithine cyclodeaminase
MRIISAKALDAALTFPALIAALREAFRGNAHAPTRHHHTVQTADGEGTLLLMPAWQEGGALGVKVVTVFGDNPTRGLPSVMGQYLLMDAATGEPRALMDGTTLTRWRTAAASALAADYLAREDARRLFMVGAGSLAPALIEAHATVRPISEVRVWSRDHANAEALAARFAGSPLVISATEDRAAGAAWADVISCATLATEPLIEGAWLQPGTHLDLVGAFRPDMRESDDRALARARLYVDTRGGAFAEAGDVLQAIETGAITKSDVVAELLELARGSVLGRQAAAEITAFKSVGASLEDLAAARLADSLVPD